MIKETVFFAIAVIAVSSAFPSEAIQPAVIAPVVPAHHDAEELEVAESANPWGQGYGGYGHGGYGHGGYGGGYGGHGGYGHGGYGHGHGGYGGYGGHHHHHHGGYGR